MCLKIHNSVYLLMYLTELWSKKVDLSNTVKIILPNFSLDPYTSRWKTESPWGTNIIVGFDSLDLYCEKLFMILAILPS